MLESLRLPHTGGMSVSETLVTSGVDVCSEYVLRECETELTAAVISAAIITSLQGLLVARPPPEGPEGDVQLAGGRAASPRCA